MIAPLSILFADHELASTRPHRMDLRRLGARVTFADTAAEIIHRAAEDPPDLLILDESLQTGSDEDVITLYLQASPQTEIILLHDGMDRTPHGLGMGLLWSTRKPFSRGSLRDVIDNAFPGRLQQPEREASGLPSILCVDEDRASLAALALLLRRRGYPVVALENAEAALLALGRQPFAVALVEIMLSGMDGIALTHEIHERSGGQVAVVGLSAIPSDEANYRVLELGARCCLTKPCPPEELLNVVDYMAGNVDSPERVLLEHWLAGSSLLRCMA